MTHCRVSCPTTQHNDSRQHKDNSSLTSQFIINLTEKLKGLSKRGLRFVGDKAKTIGQPTPDSHPHLMEEDESKYWEWYGTQFNSTQISLTIRGRTVKIKGGSCLFLPLPPPKKQNIKN